MIGKKELGCVFGCLAVPFQAVFPTAILEVILKKGAEICGSKSSYDTIGSEAMTKTVISALIVTGLFLTNYVDNPLIFVIPALYFIDTMAGAFLFEYRKDFYLN